MIKLFIAAIMITVSQAYMVPITICDEDGKCTVIYVDDGQ